MSKFLIKNWVYFIIGVLLFSFSLFFLWDYFHLNPRKNIKVGILFSETGSIAASERSTLRATLLAIDEINRAGGINNQLIVPVIYDPASKAERYGQLAEKMINKDHVRVIFGCWTSASRKEVKPVVEKFNNILIYSVQYEGVEESDNIIYLGAVPNQYVYPAVSWMVHKGKKRAYLVGTDFLSSHVINQILTHVFQSLGGQVVGTSYLPLGSSEPDQVIKDILKQKPDIIFQTISGSSNVAFFNRLNEITDKTNRPTVLTFRLSATDMNKIGLQKFAGDYAAWSYFPSLNNEKNIKFLAAYKQKYGSIEEINDPAITGYAGVYLWANAVVKASTTNPSQVRDALLRESIYSPAGIIYIDPVNGEAWRIVRIGQVDDNGNISISWTSENPIPPIAYPEFKSHAEWDLFEYRLYLQWQRKWQKDFETIH